MIKKKNSMYNLILIILAFLITVVLYNKLPDLMPVHWNVSGEIDRYGSKLFGGFFAPVIMIIMWLGMTFFPDIDPKKDNYAKFSSSYGVIISVILTFLFILHIVVILASLGYNVPVDKIIIFMVGTLFICIGNYLPKSKSNFFYGIKTPWTLSSEEVWKKTHRLGGKLSVCSGLILIINSLIFKGKIQFAVLILAMIISGVIPIVASYFYTKDDKI